MPTGIGVDPTGIISGIASVLGPVGNIISTAMTNKKNQQINQQNLDYQTKMTQQQWERDDNAHQREVADLKAAGLSPLASVGGANTSQALGAPNPIAMQAPQIDTNQLVNSLLENKALNETERHNKVEEGVKGLELAQHAEEIKQKSREISIENKRVESTIKYNADYIAYLNDQLEEVQRSNQSNESLKGLQIKSEEYFKSIQQQTGGKIPYKEYFDETEYEAALTAWANKFQSFIDEFISETSQSTSSSYSKNTSANGELNAQVLGSGFGSGAGYTSGESSSGSNSFNVSQRQAAELERFYKANPMPVYVRYSHNWN